MYLDNEAPAGMPFERNVAPYLFEAIRMRLKGHASRLFSDDGQATLDFLDLDDEAKCVCKAVP